MESRSYSPDSSQWMRSGSATTLTRPKKTESVGSSPLFKNSNFTQQQQEEKKGMDKSKSRSLLQSLTQMSTLNLNSNNTIPNSTNNVYPTPAMHWEKIEPCGKAPPRALRGHTMCMVDEKIYIFGGCDNKMCYNDLYVFDADTNWWMHAKTMGTSPPPCRAHSCIAIGKKIFFFGGGDGPIYYNTIHILDTKSMAWSTPKVEGDIPGARRAHSMWTYNNNIYIFAGGDGAKALNDVYELNIVSGVSSSTLNHTVINGIGNNINNDMNVNNNKKIPIGNGLPMGNGMNLVNIVSDMSPRNGTIKLMNNNINASVGGRGSPIANGITINTMNSDYGSVAGSNNISPVISNSGIMNNMSSQNQRSMSPVIYTKGSIGMAKGSSIVSNSSGNSSINGSGTYNMNPNGNLTSISSSNYGGSNPRLNILGNDNSAEESQIIESYTWNCIKTTGKSPVPRGYHTSNIVGSKVIIFGGSDGHECFNDIHILDMQNFHWTRIDADQPIPRLSHTATQVGSYLFIIGGHDGLKYSKEVLLLNLVTMNWETRKIFGKTPSGRGYHTAVLYDSRIYVFGGYDGHQVFNSMYSLELSACAYLPQITDFEVAEMI